VLPESSIEVAGATVTNGAVLSRIEYGYDVLGNRIWAKAPMAFVGGANVPEYTTTYGYDALLRLVSTETVYKGAAANTVYTFDAVGNKKTVKDAKGNIAEFDYDQMNRLNKTTYAKNTGVSYQVTCQYDLAGNKTAEAYPSGTWRFEYDLLNRLSITKDPYNAVASKNIYDENGNVSKRIDGRGYLSAGNDNARYGTVYTYNKANIVETVTDAEGVSVGYKYNAFVEMTVSVKLEDA
jgi:YD repeat-containing protein